MKFKIGDKYICTESKVNYWTVGKEYPVQLRTGTNPCIVDDEGTGWYPDGYEMYATFKLNEEEKEMKFKIGEQYKCVKAPNGNFTEGKLYNVECNYAGQTWLRGNDGLQYTSEQCTVGHRLNTTGLQFEKVERDKEMAFKIGDKVYGKNRHNEDWLTGEIVVTDKQWGYRIKVLNSDYKYAWLDADTVKLLLEEKPKLDLNNLTTAELREYVDLVENKEGAEFLLESFIEKVSK